MSEITQINGIPLRWNKEADRQLLGELFPTQGATQFNPGSTTATSNNLTGGESFSAFRDSPFGENWTYATIQYEGNYDDKQDYTIYVSFEGFATQEAVLNYHEGEDGNTPADKRLSSNGNLLIFIYKSLSSRNEEEGMLLCRMGAGLYNYFNADSPLSPVIDDASGKIRKLADAHKDFKYDAGQVATAIRVELENERINRVIKNAGKTGAKKAAATSAETYALNYRHFRAKCVRPDEAATIQALKKLCKTLAQLQPDVIDTNNFAVGENTNPWNYDLGNAPSKAHDLTAADLIEMRDKMLELSKKIHQLQQCLLTDADEIVQFATDYLMNGGSLMKFFNWYPFINIKKDMRKCLLRKLAEKKSLNRIASVRDDDATAGEIVFQVFQRCPQADLVPLIKELEQEGLLYTLLSKAGAGFWASVGDIGRTIFGLAQSNLFYQLSVGFGMHYLGSLDEKTKTSMQAEALAKGNYIFFDNAFFGNRNAESYETDKVKISFRVSESAIYSVPALALCKSLIDKHLANDAGGLLSPKKYFNPLEMVVMIPVADMDFTFIKMQKGAMYTMPACLAYIIFMEDTERAIRIFAKLVINLALAFTGVGALVQAMRAGSALGIFAGALDVTLGTLSAATVIPEVERNHPLFAKYVNYAALIYGLARLGYAGYKSASAGNKASKENRAALLEAATEEERALLLLSRAGTGGGLKFLRIISRRMVRQEQPMSCAAACIRQYAKDKGIMLTEEEIRTIARTSEDLGTSYGGIKDAMNSIFPGKTVRAGMADMDNVSSGDIAKLLSRNDSWIASVKPGSMRHTIIVDKIEDGKVYIRDPWPKEGYNKQTGELIGANGVEAVVDFDNFIDVWEKGGRFFAKVN
jgi:Peptidase C39 family